MNIRGKEVMSATGPRAWREKAGSPDSKLSEAFLLQAQPSSTPAGRSPVTTILQLEQIHPGLESSFKGIVRNLEPEKSET